MAPHDTGPRPRYGTNGYFRHSIRSSKCGGQLVIIIITPRFRKSEASKNPQGILVILPITCQQPQRISLVGSVDSVKSHVRFLKESKMPFLTPLRQRLQKLFTRNPNPAPPTDPLLSSETLSEYKLENCSISSDDSSSSLSILLRQLNYL